MKNMGKAIDIIIPVYNAYEDLVRCVESVFRHTDLNMHSIIFINDNSPDERIAPYLDGLQCNNVHVCHNERNYGFSHNVNIGFSFSDNDVILLNTDTVVTENWINKIESCAYSDCSIGTVTPFSNSATICSLPVFCQDNKLPEGFTVDEYAKIVEECSFCKYPEIPVAIGFCMYIKREVIEAIGNFDEDTYQRGYGEENDFCNRAQLAGYRNVLCDNTYIYHSGSASFIAKDKEKLMAEHQKILEDRFPLMCREIDAFISGNPLSELQSNINFWARVKNGRKNILYILHADFREGAENNIGGTQLHVKDLVSNLRFSENIFVLARDREYLNLTVYIEKEEICLRYYVGKVSRRPSYHEPEIAHIYEKILDVLRIDVVHIHHLLGLSGDIFQIAHRRNIPLYVTLHDFFMICPSVTMIDYEDKLCIGNTSTDICRKCLQSQKRYPEKVPERIDFVDKWRKVYGEGLRMCDRIFIPSESAKTVFLQYYPQIESLIKVIPHGINVKTRKVENQKESIKTYKTDRELVTKKNKGSEFRVAFVGGMCYEKGSRIAYEMITKKKRGIEWYIIGGIGDRDLQFLNQSNYHKMGWYQRDEIRSIIEDNEIDLICIPAVCSETFGYVLSEAIDSQIPVLAADIGALGERIRENGCGWLIPYGSGGEAYLKKIAEIRGNKEEYERIRKNVINTTGISVKQMAEKYLMEYRSNSVRSYAQEIDKKFILDGLSWAGGGATSGAEMSQRVIMLENELNAIHSSHGYKALELIRQMNIPFMKQIKSVLYVIYKFMK